MYSTFLCLAKEKLQKKRHKGGEDFDFFPSLDSPYLKRHKEGLRPLFGFSPERSP